MMFVVLLTFAEIVLHTIIVYVKGLEKDNSSLVNITRVNSVKAEKTPSWSPETHELNKTMPVSNKINHVCGRFLFPSIFMVCTITYSIIAISTYNAQHDTNLFMESECKYDE